MHGAVNDDGDGECVGGSDGDGDGDGYLWMPEDDIYQTEALPVYLLWINA